MTRTEEPKRMMKIRPALLVAEQEPDGALSTRKLVLETAKFNVITAHSPDEAREAIKVMAPGLAGLVVTSTLGSDDVCMSLAKVFKDARPDAPVFFLSPSGYQNCRWSDHQLSTYEPEKLLDVVRSALGDPRVSAPPSGPGNGR
jgi:hypothetical protein